MLLINWYLNVQFDTKKKSRALRFWLQCWIGVQPTFFTVYLFMVCDRLVNRYFTFPLIWLAVERALRRVGGEAEEVSEWLIHGVTAASEAQSKEWETEDD